VRATAEPYTYREVLERTLALIEERIYFSDDFVPRWVMGLASPLAHALERHPRRMQ
jgi:hypothetical protein